MKKQLCAFIALTASALPAMALDINGHYIPEAIQALGSSHTLALSNASSQDYYYLKDAYISSAYQANNISQMLITVTADRFSGRGLGMSIYDSVFLHSDWEEALAMEEGLNQLVKILDQPLLNGDTVAIEYQPGRGSDIYIRGEYQGTIGSEQWFNVVASNWITPDLAITPDQMQASIQ